MVKTMECAAVSPNSMYWETFCLRYRTSSLSQGFYRHREGMVGGQIGCIWNLSNSQFTGLNSLLKLTSDNKRVKQGFVVMWFSAKALNVRNPFLYMGGGREETDQRG